MASPSLVDPWLSLLRDQPLLAWAWIVMVGACIGSFLNVVVYRLPAGMSLSHPGSHCPGCGHAIRWHDNVPVLGWLLLRGRCRDCRQRIAPRYPLVELLVALLFGWLGYVDVFAVSRASPDDDLAIGVGLLRFVAHLLWLVPLLAMALIEGDGARVPRSLLVFAGVSALLVLVLAIWLLPASAQDELWRGVGGQARGSLASRAAARLVAGAAVGLAVWMLVHLRAARRGLGTEFAYAWLPETLVVGALSGLYCGANVVPVLLLAHLMALLGLRPAATTKSPTKSAAGPVTPRGRQSTKSKRGAGAPVASADSQNASEATRFRLGWLAAVLLLTLFWLD